jgi:hypothetical protein
VVTLWSCSVRSASMARQRPEIAVEVAAARHRVDVGTEEDRLEHGIRTGARREDVRGRVDAGLEPGGTHQVHGEAATRDVRVGIRGPAHAVGEGPASGAPVLAQRFKALTEATGVHAKFGIRGGRTRAAWEGQTGACGEESGEHFAARDRHAATRYHGRAGWSGVHEKGPAGTRASSVQSRDRLDDPDVLAARTLRALSSLERDGLSFTKVVEARSSARRVVKEVLIPVVGQDETEAFVTDEPLDRAVHGCCHTDLLEM